MADIDELIRKAEADLIAATPGAVPPALDDGGHLPFGGMINGTDGPSAFGKRKICPSGGTTADNPRALLLNYPPPPTEHNIHCWERNYKSSIYLDPAAEAERLVTMNHVGFGAPVRGSSCLAEANRTCGDIRKTACTRPTPSPAFDPPPRELNVPADKAEYTWQWPERAPRAKPPSLKRPEKVVQPDFLSEYDLRPPWLKF